MTNYIEFSAKIKEKYPQYKDVDDKVLAEKMLEKYPQYKEQVTFDVKESTNKAPVKKGFWDYNNEDFKADYQKLIDKRKEWEEKHPYISELQKDLQPNYRSNLTDWELKAKYGIDAPLKEQLKTDIKKIGQNLIPAINITTAAATGAGANISKILPRLGNYAKAGAIQGGVASGLHELGENGVSPEVAKNAAKGTVAGSLAGIVIPGGVNVLQGGVSKTVNALPFKNTVAKGLEVLTSVPKKYIDKALNSELAGNSILKGKFNKDTAYLPIEEKLNTAIKRLPTKEEYAQKYSDLAKRAKAGIENKLLEKNVKLNEVIKNMPEKFEDISGLRNTIDEGLDKFRFGDVNPAMDEAGSVINRAKNQLGFKNSDEIAEALKNYTDKYKSEIGINTLNPEDEDIAFSVLAQATGKNKNWLKSQLKAQLPKMSTQKRQEFIQNLLEYTDDKLENIDPAWVEKFPELNRANLQETADGGETVANKMFDRIMGKNFRKTFADPTEAMFNEADINYANILDDLTKNPNDEGYAQAIKGIENLTKNMDNVGKDAYFERLINDFDNIENIINPKIKPATLHGVKEELYDKANYSNDIFGNYGNSGIKSIAGDINQYLRKLNPEYSKINDELRLLHGVKNDITGGQGLNQNTFSGKLRNIGSEGNVLSNMDERLKNLDTLLDNEYKFYSDAERLANTQRTQNEMINTLGIKQKMRNPRLLENIKDEKGLEALNNLQKQTGVNFMDELENVKAREALESFFPGQGGGSGSSQGFGNLLRTSIIGGAPTAAIIAHNPAALAGLTAVSPKLMGQGTIKAIGALNNITNKNIPQAAYNLLIQQMNR